MSDDAMDYVREDCRRDSLIDSAGEVRMRWPFCYEPTDDNYIEPYDELEDVRPRHDEREDW